MEGRRHDWTLFLQSGLDNQLAEKLCIGGTQYCLYGDSGYSQREYLEIPYQGSALSAHQRAFNKQMSAARITVEWIFKEIKAYWSCVDFKRKLSINQSPVGALYIAAMLLTNFRNCVYPNPISKYFDCHPPSLESYIGDHENN
jgi:DDE superfamily endonuclease